MEATLRRLIEPAVADVEESNTAEAGPVAADVEEADAPPAGPEHDDTAKCRQCLRNLAESNTNMPNFRNSRSLNLSRFRLLRRKGVSDLWR